VFAAKLYPAGATTNSASGVTDITKIYDTLRAMAAYVCRLPLRCRDGACLH
jgi:dihydroorotase